MLSKQKEALRLWLRAQGLHDVKWALRCRHARSTRNLIDIMEDVYFLYPQFNLVDIDEETGAGLRLECGDNCITILLRGDVKVL